MADKEPPKQSPAQPTQPSEKKADAAPIFTAIPSRQLTETPDSSEDHNG